MNRPFVQQPCEYCDTKVYAGNGLYDCSLPDQTCDQLRVCEWAEEVAFDITTMIAKATYVSEPLRRQFAAEVCDAFANLLYEVGAKIDSDEFMRRAGLPAQEEVR